MNHSDEFERWRESRATPEVPADFADRVLLALPERSRPGLLRLRLVRAAVVLLFIAGFAIRMLGVVAHFVTG